MGKEIVKADVLELVRKIRNFEKCKKCDCMRETLLSLSVALDQAERESMADELLEEVAETLEMMMPSEYT